MAWLEPVFNAPGKRGRKHADDLRPAVDATRAVVGVKPLLLAHGHFHVAGDAVVRLPGAGRGTTIWSLAARHDPGNVRLLDLNTIAEAGQPTRRAAHSSA